MNKNKQHKHIYKNNGKGKLQCICGKLYNEDNQQSWWESVFELRSANLKGSKN